MNQEKFFLNLAARQFPVVKSLRRVFHRIPELGFEEEQTTERIMYYLKGAGISPKRLSPTGVTAYLGPAGAKTVALRADIDGLAVREATGLPFASEIEGHMHACGHDGHIAALLGAAFVLKEAEDRLPVRVKLIFQPSEENTRGAKHLIKQGVLKDVDLIFGLHLFSDMNVHVVSIQEGPRMAQTDRFRIVMKGHGGHAGKPHQCVDATVMAADFIMSSQSIISRSIDPVKGGVLTVGRLCSGTQYNIISGEALIEGTCRSFYQEVAVTLRDQIKKRAEAVAAYHGGTAEITYDFGSHPPVVNPLQLTRCIKSRARALLGEEKIRDVPAAMYGEDFSWYQQEVPGVFAFVGCKDPTQEVCYPNHHPCFDIADEALYDALLLHISAVLAAGDYEE